VQGAYTASDFSGAGPMSQPAILTRFKSFYADLVRTEWAQIDDIYTSDICFCDPIHCVKGLPDLHNYIAELCESLTTCRFEYLDEVVMDGTAYIKWNMTYAHPSIKGGKILTLRGVTQIEFNDSGIYYHEDIYDMGAMLYEHIPVLGSGVRWIKHRLNKAAA
jgi:hypothetical protein